MKDSLTFKSACNFLNVGGQWQVSITKIYNVSMLASLAIYSFDAMFDTESELWFSVEHDVRTVNGQNSYGFNL